MSQSVPKCAKEENGNNDSFSSLSNPLYKYDFVINNYTDTEVCQVKETIKRICKKGGFGFEVGESGTPHLQGYISLAKKQRKTGLLKEPGFARASFRAVRNEDALISYFQKDGNTWTHGFPKPKKPIKIITDLLPWQKDAEALLTSPDEDDRTIHWWWGPTGKIGKSQFTKYMIVKHKVLLCKVGKYSDLMNLVFNQDMDETDCVIFDLPRSSHGKIDMGTLESIKDGMVCNTKFETGVKIFNSPKIMVFSNHLPLKSEDLSADRLNVRNIESHYGIGNPSSSETTITDDNDEFCDYIDDS